jgi:hypothetical protein
MQSADAASTGDGAGSAAPPSPTLPASEVDPDVPSLVLPSGTKVWLNDKMQKHRLHDLPAVVATDGREEHWFEGKRHRPDGKSAFSAPGEPSEWWVDGVQFESGGSYEYLTALRVFYDAHGSSTLDPEVAASFDRRNNRFVCGTN